MRVQVRLVLLLLLALVSLNALFVFIDRSEREKIQDLYASAKRQKLFLFDKIFFLQSKSLEFIVRNYTLLDEMTNFVLEGDPEWAKNNIDILLSSQYDFDAVWVYKSDFSEIYAVNNIFPEAQKSTVPISAAELKEFFSKRDYGKFYIRTPQGVLEIQGAAIHAAADFERKGEIFGYFLAGHLWNAPALAELGRLTASTVQLKDWGEESRITPVENDERGRILFSRMVPGWDGSPVAKIEVRSQAEQVVVYDLLSKKNFFLLQVFSWNFLGIFLLALLFWVSLPLARISRALKEESVLPIEPLRSQNNEFGRIAQMIKDALDVRRKLLHEIDNRADVESRLKLQNAILEVAANGIVITDRKGDIVWANPSFTRLTGYPLPEVLGKNPRILKSGMQDPHFYEEIWQTIVQGRVWHGELINRRRDGSLYTEEMTITPRFDEKGDISHFIAIKQDVSDRKKIEQQLRESERRYRLLANNAVDVIWTTDLKLQLTYCSPSVKKLLGYAVEEILHLPLSKLLAPSSLELVMKIFQEELFLEKKGDRDPLRSRTLEVKLLRNDGEIVWTELEANFLKDESGKPLGVVGSARNITERKMAHDQLKKMLTQLAEKNQELQRTQAQLLQSEKMAAIGQLSAGVAHEIKNPLAIIQQALEQLEPGLKSDDPKIRRYLEMLKKAAQRADRVVVELLNFSRFSDITWTPVDLQAAIDAAVLLVESEAQLRGIRVIKDYGPGVPKILGEQILLEQIFLNLLNNAVDAVSREGFITLSTRYDPPTPESPRRVRVEIADTGCGIPEELLPRVFEPFFTTKEQGRGTGLGLSTVYMILEKHRAQIEVQSRKNLGTKFLITFLEICRPEHEAAGGA